MSESPTAANNGFSTPDTAAFPPARFHNWNQAGVMCAPGCLQLASASSLSKRGTKYRVNVSDLASLVEATGGICMLCRVCHASIVEHCHETGRVRGLVCRWCNHRIAALEAAHTGRPAVYPRRYLCPCVNTRTDRDGASATLEAATYAFIDHAADMVASTPRQALALLVQSPYPPN